MRIGYGNDDSALDFEDISCKCKIVGKVKELLKRKDITVIKIEL